MAGPVRPPRLRDMGMVGPIVGTKGGGGLNPVLARLDDMMNQQRAVGAVKRGNGYVTGTSTHTSASLWLSPASMAFTGQPRQLAVSASALTDLTAGDVCSLLLGGAVELATAPVGPSGRVTFSVPFVPTADGTLTFAVGMPSAASGALGVTIHDV